MRSFTGRLEIFLECRRDGVSYYSAETEEGNVLTYTTLFSAAAADF
jgi:hypothetical protein